MKLLITIPEFGLAGWVVMLSHFLNEWSRLCICQLRYMQTTWTNQNQSIFTDASVRSNLIYLSFPFNYIFVIFTFIRSLFLHSACWQCYNFVVFTEVIDLSTAIASSFRWHILLLFVLSFNIESTVYLFI